MRARSKAIIIRCRGFFPSHRIEGEILGEVADVHVAQCGSDDSIMSNIADTDGLTVTQLNVELNSRRAGAEYQDV